MREEEIRAAALDAAVRSHPTTIGGSVVSERTILNRAESFAYYIETGIKT